MSEQLQDLRQLLLCNWLPVRRGGFVALLWLTLEPIMETDDDHHDPPNAGVFARAQARWVAPSESWAGKLPAWTLIPEPPRFAKTFALGARSLRPVTLISSGLPRFARSTAERSPAGPRLEVADRVLRTLELIQQLEPQVLGNRESGTGLC